MNTKHEIDSYDRRKHKRFDMDFGCYIQNADSECFVKDISIGGLSCRCSYEKGCNKEFPQNTNIYCTIYNLAIIGINMEFIDSTTIYSQLAGSLGIRECRFKFNTLKLSQINQVNEIILKTIYP